MKFYKCKKCGKITTIVDTNQNIPNCCHELMVELIPGSVEAAEEKHIPVASNNMNDYFVTVGEIEHPMTTEHYIEWIAFELDDNSIKIINLKPNEKPIAHFETEQKVKAIYAYCNLHGLWKAEI